MLLYIFFILNIFIQDSHVNGKGNYLDHFICDIGSPLLDYVLYTSVSANCRDLFSGNGTLIKDGVIL